MSRKNDRSTRSAPGGRAAASSARFINSQPAIARGAVDRESGVAETEAGMAARLDVAHRAAEPEHQKISEPALGGLEVAAAIHRAEDVVGGHLCVEPARQTGETLLADGAVDVFFVHPTIIRARE